jgi:eukaryotic-like serine/threonine-protein kinase
MLDLQPDNTDAILGGQNPPPTNAVVLGGMTGMKRQVLYEWGLREELVNPFSFETVTVNDSGEIFEQKQKDALCYTENLNGIPIEMVYIPAGEFLMGGSIEFLYPGNIADYKDYKNVAEALEFEKPIHLVTLKSFFMAKYPITQAQYQAVMLTNPSKFQGDDRHPVETVSWDNAMEFCRRLSELTSKNFSLPSESQWEYACRSGTNTRYCYGQKISFDLVNYSGCEHFNDSHREDIQAKCQYKTTFVGNYPPNPWGLYDMHGNVWEWCLDTRHDNYIDAPTDGSAWIESDGDHPVRGGAWNDLAHQCMSYKRLFASGGYQTPHNGFRICMLP